MSQLCFGIGESWKRIIVSVRKWLKALWYKCSCVYTVCVVCFLFVSPVGQAWEVAGVSRGAWGSCLFWPVCWGWPPWVFLLCRRSLYHIKGAWKETLHQHLGPGWNNRQCFDWLPPPILTALPPSRRPLPQRSKRGHPPTRQMQFHSNTDTQLSVKG